MGFIRCENCGEKFQDFDQYITHFTREHCLDEVCLMCKEQFNSSKDVRKHLRHLRCFNFRKHLREIGSELLYQLLTEEECSCVTCGNIYLTKIAMERHQRKHLRKQSYKCETCGKNFYFRRHYDRHLNNAHSSDVENINMTKNGHPRLYCCNFCPKSFTTPVDLRVHHRTHSGEKPFECQHCGRLFTQKGNLNVHIKRHRNNGTIYCKDTNNNSDIEFNNLQSEFKLIHPQGNKKLPTNKKPNDTSYIYIKFKKCELSFMQNLIVSAEKDGQSVVYSNMLPAKTGERNRIENEGKSLDDIVGFTRTITHNFHGNDKDHIGDIKSEREFLDQSKVFNNSQHSNSSINNVSFTSEYLMNSPETYNKISYSDNANTLVKESHAIERMVNDTSLRNLDTFLKTKNLLDTQTLSNANHFISNIYSDKDHTYSCRLGYEESLKPVIETVEEEVVSLDSFNSQSVTLPPGNLLESNRDQLSCLSSLTFNELMQLVMHSDGSSPVSKVTSSYAEMQNEKATGVGLPSFRTTPMKAHVIVANDATPKEVLHTPNVDRGTNVIKSTNINDFNENLDSDFSEVDLVPYFHSPPQINRQSSSSNNSGLFTVIKNVSGGEIKDIEYDFNLTD